MNPRDGQNIEWGIHYLSFGIPAMLVQMAAVVIFILINAKAIENGTPYEVGDPNERPASVPEVPIWTYVLPVVPVALSIVFQWDSVPALFLAAIIAFFGTGYMKTYKGFVSILNSTAKTAIGDIGSLIIMLLVLRFFQHAAVTVMADFGPALTAVVPNNEFILALAVCILAPLALFRGPLELYGAGSAVISILMGHGRVQQLVPVRHARGALDDLHLQLCDPVLEHVGRGIQRARTQDLPQERRAGLLAVHLPDHGTGQPAAVLTAHLHTAALHTSHLT